MAMYTTLRNGSSGDEVRKLQEKLKAAGYDVGSTGADGIYGARTEAAVRKYQQDNNLDVDGIAGDQTLGKLYASTTQAQVPAAGEQAQAQTPSYRYNADEDTVYQEALKQLQDAKGNAPVYAGTYDQQLKDIYDRIVNREKFSYDLNGDALWKQYKDQYTQKGQMAMLDTMGQAAALTGGYGNSYAQNVGQQVYQGHLQKLNEMVPTLYQLALDSYNAEGDRMNQQFTLTGQLANDEYGKYQDAQTQYWQNVDRAQSAADTAYDRGQSSWYTEQQLKNQEDEKNYNRQQNAYDRLANLISSSGYSPSQAELAAAGMSAGEAAAYAKYYSDQQQLARSSVYARQASSAKDDTSSKGSWGSGIDEERPAGTGQLKGSAWDYTKHNLSTLLRTGNVSKADEYMEMILDEVSKSQFEELVEVYKQYGYRFD